MNNVEFKRKALGDLKDRLPERILFTLQRELENWKNKDPSGLLDEHKMRYTFLSVLKWHGVECPHPWRKQIHEHIPMEDGYECTMCRAYIMRKL